MLLVILLMTSLCVGSSLGHCHLDFGDPCSSDDECWVKCVKEYSNCNKGKCGCHPGDVQEPFSTICYTPSVLGGSCADPHHCVGIAGGSCNTTIGSCLCDANKRQITRLFCVEETALSPTDLCNATNTPYFFITETDTMGRGRYAGTFNQPCGCPASHYPDAQNAQKCIFNTSSIILTTVAPIEYGPRFTGQSCIKSGDDLSQQCGEGLTCSVCPGENTNKFTCNAPYIGQDPQQNIDPTANVETTTTSESPALSTESLSFVLVTLTSFGITLMM